MEHVLVLHRYGLTATQQAGNTASMKAITIMVEDSKHRWLKQEALNRGISVKALLLGGVLGDTPAVLDTGYVEKAGDPARDIAEAVVKLGGEILDIAVVGGCAASAGGSGEETAKVSLKPKPGSLLSRMGVGYDPPPVVMNPVTDLPEHKAFVVCVDPGCKMKVRHGAH